MHISGVCKKDHPKCDSCEAKWDYLKSLDPEELMIFAKANLWQGPRGSRNNNGEKRKRDETYWQVSQYIRSICTWDEYVSVRAGKKAKYTKVRKKLIVKTKREYPEIINAVIQRALNCSVATITKAMKEQRCI